MDSDSRILNAIGVVFDKIGLAPVALTDSTRIFREGVASMGELDSLLAIQVAVELEDILGRAFVPAGFTGATTIGDLRLEIQRQLDND